MDPPPRRAAGAAAGAADASGGASLARLKEELSDARRERDRYQAEAEALQKDVEALCISNVGSSLSDTSSSVLSNRIKSLEVDLDSRKRACLRLEERGRELQDEILEHKKVQRTMQNEWKAELQRSSAREEELRFFQAQATSSIAQRDKAASEVEGLREANTRLSRELRECEKEAKASTSAVVKAQREVETQRAQIALLQQAARDSAVVAPLREELSNVIAERDRLRKIHHEMKQRVEQEQEQAREARDTVRGATGRVRELEARCKELEEEVAAERADADAEMEASHAEREQERAHLAAAEVRSEAAEARLAVMEHELHVSRERAGDLERQLREAPPASGEVNEEVAALRAQVAAVQVAHNSQREQLASATQQKVELLLLLSQEDERHSLEGREVIKLEGRLLELEQALASAVDDKMKALARLAEVDSSPSPSPLPSGAGAGGRPGGSQGGWSPSRAGAALFRRSPSQDRVAHGDSPARAAAAGGGVGAVAEEAAAAAQQLRVLSIENAGLKERLSQAEMIAGKARKLRLALLAAGGDGGGEDKGEGGGAREEAQLELKRLKIALGVRAAAGGGGGGGAGGGGCEEEMLALLEGLLAAGAGR